MGPFVIKKISKNEDSASISVLGDVDKNIVELDGTKRPI